MFQEFLLKSPSTTALRPDNNMLANLAVAYVGECDPRLRKNTLPVNMIADFVSDQGWLIARRTQTL